MPYRIDSSWQSSHVRDQGYYFALAEIDRIGIMDYGHRTAYLLAFLLPDKTYARVGVYSEFPPEQSDLGMWIGIDRIRGKDYQEAYERMVERWHAEYSWLKGD